MSQQHPLDLGSTENREGARTPSTVADDELSASDLAPTRPFSPPIPDNVIRASSPFGRRYLKPINGIQTKGFARSAQRRSSVLTLGSIERLQNFYAVRELKVNKAGMLGFQKQALVEEPEDLDKLPTPQAPPPSWSGLDVETDLDVLLSQCFDDIQQMLTQWAMVTGPREHHSYSSQGSHTSNDSADDNGFQILPLLDSVTKMINSVKNYMHQRHDLSDAAFQKVRHAALNLLESLKVLETRFRKDQEDENGEYTYHTSEFGMLENERRAIHNYLRTVEKYAFNPPHHIGSPPAVFSSEIRALLARTAVVDDVKEAPSPSQPALGIPVWLERGSFQGDDLGRYHALLNDNRHSVEDETQNTEPIPDPHEDEDAFLTYLADGITLCNAYNNIVKRSRRPFGYISKIHKDTQRTYRATENLRFFAAACSFRFDLTLKEFDPSEVARKTDKGLQMLKEAVAAFCETVIKELREYVDNARSRRSLPAQPPVEDLVTEYLEKKLVLEKQESSS